MNRITDTERKRFHKILNDSIDKLNSPKNANKEHWSKITIQKLQKYINIENAELECAVFDHSHFRQAIEPEGFDIINYTLFMIDNIRNNKLLKDSE